jgi:hypothetical protein
MWPLRVPSLAIGILYADHALVALLIEYDWHLVNRESVGKKCSLGRHGQRPRIGRPEHRPQSHLTTSVDPRTLVLGHSSGR